MERHALLRREQPDRDAAPRACARRGVPAPRLAARRAGAARARGCRGEQDRRRRRRHSGVRLRLRSVGRAFPRPRAFDPRRARRRGLPSASSSSAWTRSPAGRATSSTQSPRARASSSRSSQPGRAMVSIATSSVWQLAILVGGLAVLGYFATLRPASRPRRVPGRDRRLPRRDDSPTKVAGYGAIVCGALRCWSVSRVRVGIESNDVRS